MLFSLGSGASPCISTIVSASVEPLARGEALAAIALVRSVSEFLSPIILGSIMNATIDTSMPQAMFFVSSAFLPSYETRTGISHTRRGFDVTTTCVLASWASDRTIKLGVMALAKTEPDLNV
ncbi:hypothetical protein FS749_009795 [Ceratobasidium sp. UAMH 11750]|nr:hypothetical protein FS749_009795 [Ceratobasidium sp. UAMH 11750]